MKELININKSLIGSEEVNSVNSRDIHETLELKKDFSDWIKAQIKTLGLEENIDFITYHLKGVGGKFDSIEYVVTLDTAKHIAMASRTKKGKEVRNYFIQIEKEYISQNCSSELKPNLDYKAGKVSHVIHKPKEHYYLDASLMREMRLTLGLKTTREFYCELLKKEPEEIESQVFEYSVEVKEFIKSCVVEDDEYFTKKDDLYEAYVSWAKLNGIMRPLSDAKFTRNYNNITGTKSEQKRFGMDRYRCYKIRLL